MRKLRESGTRRESLRIAAFATFFKSYMSVSAIVAASVPIPVAALKLIPTYSQQRGFLSVYASLFCFLLVAFVFSIRHQLATRMFSGGRRAAFVSALPALFILLTMFCILGYHATLQRSLQQWRELGVVATSTDLLNKADYLEIPYSLSLAAYYLGIFVFAELAFVLMAMREYLQDALQLKELTLLRGEPSMAQADSVLSRSAAQDSKGSDAPADSAEMAARPESPQ